MTAALVLWIEKGVRTPMVFTYLTLGRSIVQSSVLVYNLVFLFVSIGYQPYSRLGGYSTTGTISA